MDATLYFDGGCKPNPGQMSCGVVIVRPDGGRTISEITDLGHGTNNIAEWSGLIHAIQVCKDRGFTDVEIKGDSKLVIMQAGGQWRVKDETLKILHAEYKVMSDGLNIKLTHVLRSFNLAGIYLESGYY